MKVLVVGGNGREHAICRKLYEDPKVSQIYCIPGNGGISEIAACINIDILDFDRLVQFSKEHNIDYTIVGPELPLSLGIVDKFQENNLKIFGPTKIASQMETSKVFAKNFMKEFNIPTADYNVFDNPMSAKEYIMTAGKPLVIKADGLSSGKGVFVCNDKIEATVAVQTIMEDKKFGDSGNKIIIEEKLEGYELSLLLFVNGTSFESMIYAKDHKRIFDGDKGENTGGMGCIAPIKISYGLEQKILYKIIYPTINGMYEKGLNYCGVLFIGLMIVRDGNWILPKVLEYNVRFGDPETQVILPLMRNKLIDVIKNAIDHKLERSWLTWYNKYATCVVLSSAGYPGKYEVEKEITGLENIKDSHIFHSGTILKDNKYYTNGGRVLAITSLGKDREESIKNVYEEVQKINFEGMYYRRDIGKCV